MPALVETMAYYGEVPWHGLGTQVDGLMTAKDAIVQAGLDWQVDLWPTFTANVDEAGDEAIEPIQIENAWTTVRTSDQQPFGVVGSQFTPVQNVEAFDFLDKLVEDDVAKYETAGSLRGGAHVWMLMKWLEHMRIGDDEVASYLFCQNRHDGKGGLMIGDTNVRIVCANTAQLAARASRHYWYFRHSANIADRIEAARTTMQLTLQARTEFVEKASAMLTRKITNKQLQNVLDTVWPIDSTEMSKVAISRAEERRDSIRNILKTAPDLQSIKGSAWGVYNAFVAYADHGRNFRSREARMDAIMSQGGTSAKLKEQALDVITATVAA